MPFGTAPRFPVERRCRVSRYCDHCGADDLRMFRKGHGHWRKECAICGSTGPFTPQPPVRPVDVSAAPHIHRRTMAQLAAGVERFTQDGSA
jgi:hypothetical protein